MLLDNPAVAKCYEKIQPAIEAVQRADAAICARFDECPPVDLKAHRRAEAAHKHLQSVLDEFRRVAGEQRALGKI